MTSRLKLAYDIGVQLALYTSGLSKLSSETPVEGPQTGKETRLRKDHEPSKFFNSKRTFDRAKQKEMVGTHVSLREDPPST